jgi:hypothetical protein
MPRKTLFKPLKKPNLANDPLWKEVFLASSSDDEDEDDDFTDEHDNANLLQDIYQLGLGQVGSQKSTMSMFQKNAGIELAPMR